MKLDVVEHQYQMPFLALSTYKASTVNSTVKVIWSYVFYQKKKLLENLIKKIKLVYRGKTALEYRDVKTPINFLSMFSLSRISCIKKKPAKYQLRMLLWKKTLDWECDRWLLASNNAEKMDAQNWKYIRRFLSKSILIYQIYTSLV